ncbi:MAG: zinc dependent phospholipase C family protein [Thermodesulfobacteriota bacterium]|nr:zinc dependent phospholipase C family protein [Thermodesulfobacteriota bacterium]
MPKEISHILIAKEVLTDLKRSESLQMANLIEKNLPSFYLGAIIPDAFFYDMTPVVRMSANNLWVSRALHTKDGAENDKKAVGFFEGISATSPAWEAKVAFAAGIVTHTVSDRMVHGVIDYVTKSWGEKNGTALATHRQFETLMDMVLLQPTGVSPRRLQLDGLVHLHPSTRDILFCHYLFRVAGASKAQAPALLRAFRRAHVQQFFFVRLFAVKGIYQIMALLNTLAAGRLEPWFRLCYPEEVAKRSFPIMDSLDLNALTDGHSFSGSLAWVVNEIVADAIDQIGQGLQRLE